MHVIPASASASTAAALSQFEQAVDQLEACAPAPRVAQRLLALLQDGQAPLAEVERALAVDGGLVVRVLRLASSPVFAARQVTSLRFAVQALGSAQLCRVVCAAQLASGGSPFTRRLWAYALRVACVSDELARHAAPRPTADPFLCGLLHDVGTMALERFLGPRYLAAGFAPGDDAQLEIERTTFGFDHCDLGAMIAARWQLFPELELVAQLHHDPDAADALALPPATRAAIDVVALARVVGAPPAGGLDEGHLALCARVGVAPATALACGARGAEAAATLVAGLA